MGMSTHINDNVPRGTIKYQIRYCDSKGNGYFKYFDVDSKKKA